MAAGSSSNGDVVTRDLVQDGRVLTITTTLGANVVGVEYLEGTEEVSQPFEYHLRLLSYNNEIDCASLLQSSVTVGITLPDGSSRYLNGIFSRFSQGQGTSQDFYVYEATMVPSIWLLSLSRNCKIFQNMTVPAIVQQVLQDAGITAVSMSTTGTYTARDFCVQYRETTLDFISRLLEEEGIYYYFAHQNGTHTITFADTSKSATAISSDAFSYSGAEKHGPAGTNIYSLTRTYQPCSQTVVVQDYGFMAPSQTQQATTTSTADSTIGEYFEYPGDDSNNMVDAATSTDSTTLSTTTFAKTRIEELETFTCTIEGEADIATFSPGYKITIENHEVSDINTDYFLDSVSHEALDTTYRTSPDKAGGYSNTYHAIPLATVYRPSRKTSKPVVYGPQTAVVVGPSGQEIYTDQYGRVKVQFFWDRVGTNDENSSCWMRVSQIWAGKNWGWITIPRIGQEVIVSFLEGDPDRPIITGRVYNGDQTVPYTLPDNKTQSGIRSRSSMSGQSANYNEIQFEDNKGSELITVHAEKDMLTEVENNDTQTVDNNRTITVKGTHTETITKDTSITITQGNHTLDVQTGNHSITVDKGNHSMTVSVGNHSVTVDTGNQSINVNTGSQSTTVTQAISITSMESITLTVADSSIEITPTNINLSAPMINISAEGIVGMSGAVVQIEGDITLIN